MQEAGGLLLEETVHGSPFGRYRLVFPLRIGNLRIFAFAARHRQSPQAPKCGRTASWAAGAVPSLSI